MKNLTTAATKLFLIGSLATLSLTSVKAANVYWKGGSNSALTSTNWSSTQAGTGAAGNPGATSTATFSANNQTETGAITPTLNNDATWGSIEVNTHQTQAVTLQSSSGTGRTLTLGTSGGSNLITLDSGAGAFTLGNATNDVALETASTAGTATFTFINNSSSNLTIQNGVDGVQTTNNRTITFEVGGTGTGSTIFNGVIENDNTGNTQLSALTVDSGATATLNATNTYTGATTVNGTLNATHSGAIAAGSAVTVSGGTLNATVNGAVASTNITISGGGIVNANAGSSISANNVAITIGGTGSTLNINAAAGVSDNGAHITVNTGGSLVFGANAALNTAATVTLGGGSIVLNGKTETIGTLTLTAGTANTIDLSGGGLLTINNITWGAGATLNIIGWTGPSLTTGDGTHQIILGGAGGAWSDIGTHLGAITWTDTTVGSSTGTVDGAARQGNAGVGGQLTPGSLPVTPAPEPSTIFIGLGLIALLAWGGRNKIAEAGRNLVSVRS